MEEEEEALRNRDDHEESMDIFDIRVSKGFSSDSSTWFTILITILSSKQGGASAGPPAGGEDFTQKKGLHHSVGSGTKD
jgi:hypothetical protein